MVSTPVPGSHAFAAPVNVIANGVPLSSAPLPSNPVISAAPPSVMFPAAAIIHGLFVLLTTTTTFTTTITTTVTYLCFSSSI